MTGIIEVHKSDAGVLAATDDEHAVAAWLAARGQRSTHTRESYQRESRRLLIWLRARRLTLRTMTVEDVHSFYEHLASPPTHWIRPRKPAANALLLDTQLLAGPLSPKSINYARTVLGQMMSYLQDAGYVQRNAFRLGALGIQDLSDAIRQLKAIIEPAKIPCDACGVIGEWRPHGQFDALCPSCGGLP